MDHWNIVQTLLGVTFLFLVLKESQGSDLDPLGENVCSKTQTRNPRVKRFLQERPLWGGYSSIHEMRNVKPKVYTSYYCCPGWRRSGRSCSIPDPCPKGKENCDDFPINLVPTPTVSYRKGLATQLEMLCRFTFHGMKDVSYLVEWYNGRSNIAVKKDSWCIPDNQDCSRRESSIRLSDHFALGDTVWCRLFMKNSKKKTNKWTATGKDSNQYYVGIQVSPRHVIVKECNIGENIKVTLRPTVPIAPIMDTPDADRILVSVLIPQKYKAKRRQAAVDKCHVELKTQDITHGKTITIRGICDNQQDQRESYSFHFKPQGTGTSWLDLENYRMPSVKVTVDNTDTKVCLTTTDPNLFTFDNRKLFYNEIGDYVMYSNEAKKIQVHVRLWLCSGQMTCVCGAAIREGKDVIVISMCNKMQDSVPTILRTFKRSPGSLSKGIQITKQIAGATMEQEVILSSGTRISVMRAGKSLDVRINAPGTDKGKVSGLCGNFNGDPGDDFDKGGDGYRIGSGKEEEKEFASSWRIPDGKSFFKILPGPEEEGPEPGRSCYCAVEGEEDQQDAKCDDNANIFTRIDATQIEVLTTQFNDQAQFGMKRSVATPWYSDDIIDHVDRSYFVDDPHVLQAMNRIRTKRSPREVISKNEATTYCRSQIEASKAGGVCNKIAATNIKNAMIQCVNDLTLTGDKTFAALAFNTMKYVCEDSTLKNLSLYTHTASGELVPPRQAVEDLCPADCSGHGRCRNRTCICDKGFTALDCSMEVQAVPELLGIYNGGLCDIRERPCKKTNLLGQKFINSNNLTCHVKELKVYTGSWSPHGIPFTTQGKMTDLFGVKCDLPDPPTKLDDHKHEGTPAGGLLISVSNDGFRASTQELRHVTYDSKCMTCSKSGKCQRKANSCLIRGHCFAAFEPNPGDWCRQCLPRDNQNSWTQRKDNQAPKFTSNPTYQALQGEDLVIQLKAADPDNRPVTYSLLSSTATGFTFSPAGILRWKVTSNEKFTIKVTDECGAYDRTDMRVHIVQCPCLNGGQCVPHPYHPRGSGVYQCKCLDGTSGDRCEKTLAIAGEKIPNAAPIIRDITPVRYDTIRITWSPIPVDQHNGTIRGYKIYYRQMYTKNKWNVLTTKKGYLNVAMVTGLRSYIEYCVKMSAFTFKGEYPEWERKPCKTVKTPSLPIKVSGQALSRTEIILRFQKPKQFQAPPFNRVQVDYGKQSHELKKKKVCYGSSCVISNLEEDIVYYFRVIGYVYQKGETPSLTQIRTLSRGS